MYYTRSRLSNEADNFLFDLDEQCKQSTVFDNNIFSDWLTDDPATHATSSAELTSILFQPPMAPLSPSVVSSSSLGSPLSTSLSTSPPACNALQQETFEAPQYSGSTEEVSSYDNKLLTAYPHSYRQLPVWAASLWENSSAGSFMTDERFPVKTAANTTIDPPFARSRESLPNDVFAQRSQDRFHSALDKPVSEVPSRMSFLIRPICIRIADPSFHSVPQKSLLKPPKLDPSAWQLYFTDFIQKAQANTTKKLNIAQAAREAGQEYANLSSAEKEVRSLSNLDLSYL